MGIDMNCQNRSRILMQFHITGKCNLRCKHCYRTEGDVEPLSFRDVIAVIDQFRELRREYNRRNHTRRKGHINLTGGEPFFRKDIKEILLYLGEHREELTYGILSNGSFINDEMIGILRQTGAVFVQLSLDGNQETHDFLRAEGDYNRVLQTAEYLESQGIPTYISFTANRDNYRQLPAVAKECRKRKITKLWSDRLVPIGNEEDLRALAITAEDLPDYVGCLKKARGNFLTCKLYPKTQVTMNRALQFLYASGDLYACSAGKSLITVDEFGNVMPCRRMPMVCGSVLETTLTELYLHHEIFKRLRMPFLPMECASCQYAYRCRGGARCQSYAAYGTLERADPGCPLV